jgi:hypothetical protein
MPSARGRVDLNNPKEQAGDGHPKERVNSDSPDDWAGNGRLKMRSTKVFTKSGHGFSVETVNEDVSSGDDFPLPARLQVLARTMSLMVRQQERPSRHTKGLPQQGMGRQPA